MSRISARPKAEWIICRIEKLSHAARLCRSLQGIRSCVGESKLITANGIWLVLKVESRECQRVLSIICEYSQAVLIGSIYKNLICEHGSEIIKDSALEKLVGKAL